MHESSCGKPHLSHSLLVPCTHPCCAALSRPSLPLPAAFVSLPPLYPAQYATAL